MENSKRLRLTKQLCPGQVNSPGGHGVLIEKRNSGALQVAARLGKIVRNKNNNTLQRLTECSYRTASTGNNKPFLD